MPTPQAEVEQNVGVLGGSGGEDNSSTLPSRVARTSSVTPSSTVAQPPPPPTTTNIPSGTTQDSAAVARPTKRKVKTATPTRERSPTRSSTAAASSGPPLRDQSSTTTANTLAPQPRIHEPRPQRPYLNAPSSTSVKSTSPASRSRSPVPPSRSPAPPTRKQNAPTPPPPAKVSKEGTTTPEGLEETEKRSLTPSGMQTPRTNSSAALETVVESSLPSTPAIGTSRLLVQQMAALASARQPEKFSEDDDDTSATGSIRTVRQGRAGSISSSIAPSSRAESESESGYRSEDRTPTRSRPSSKQPQPQPKYARRPTVSGKEISQQGMTVETETVSSIPQVGLGNVGAAGGASIRSKKSTDTIRAPKREKRKLRRTVPAAVNNASTKSELFAIRVAEAVNQANSSDSDETFVYESNPPESAQRPSSRFHSRTPSATSLGGPDPRGLRLPLLSTIDGTTSTGRKVMKFVNNSINKEPHVEGDHPDRAAAGSSRDAHRERNGRNNRSVPEMVEENAFNRRQNVHTLRHAASSLSSHPPSNPASPKMLARSNVPSRKSTRQWTQYEADIEGFEDDESTPLVRRNGRRRQGNGSLRQLEHSQSRRRSWARTYFACIVALLSTTLVLSGIAGFLLTTTNPLQDVHLLNVTDVLVAKQEIMLDLVVEAINPNIIPVTIGSMDINIFAKSSHIRDEPEKDPERPDDDEPADPDDPFSDITKRDSVDHGTDPDQPEDKETMLLGRIFAFDSVLQFEGTPWKKTKQISTGELRLQRPGNKTEEGGTERWERVLGHPFELIVRGVLKYQLPLSGRIRTAPVAGRVGIWPEGEDKTAL